MILDYEDIVKLSGEARVFAEYNWRYVSTNREHLCDYNWFKEVQYPRLFGEGNVEGND